MTELEDMTHTDKKDLGSKVGKEKKKNKNVLLPTNVQNGYKMVLERLILPLQLF